MATAQAFVFDAYGTLFEVDAVVAALRAVAPEAEAVSRLWRQKPLEYSWLRSLMGRYVDFWTVTDEALRFALKHYGLELPANQHAAILEAYLHLSAYAEIPAMLERLSPRPCAICSNGSPRMLAAAIAASGLDGRFAHLLSADHVRVDKPDPRVYALAPQALAVPKEAIVFVSANAFDAMGAKAYGFQVVWINRLQGPMDELGFAPDLVLTRLNELPEASANEPAAIIRPVALADREALRRGCGAAAKTLALPAVEEAARYAISTMARPTISPRLSAA